MTSDGPVYTCPMHPEIRRPGPGSCPTFGMALEPVPRAMRAAVLEGHATATDLADYLVRKGVPFRDAHEVVARAVREAERLGRDLAALPLATLQRFSAKIGADAKALLTPEGSVAARNHVGGTAPAQVRAAVARARKRLT